MTSRSSSSSPGSAPSPSTPRARWWTDVGVAAAAGLLVFASGYPVECPWLQLLAFVPLLMRCVKARSWRGAALLGGIFGLARVIPMGIMLEGLGVPPLAAVPLVLYLLLLDASFAAAAFAMRRWPTAVFALGVGTTFSALEWLDALLPMWGTARSLARSWAIAPEVMGGLIRLGGPALVALCIVGLQAIIAMALVRRRPASLALTLPVLLGMLAAQAVEAPAPEHTLRVGAVAWAQREQRDQAERLIAEAAAQGARLVVLPESAFELPAGKREAFLHRWGTVARDHSVFLVVGVRDRDRPGNRLIVFDPQGRPLGQYTKTHLIPLSETVPPGDGELLVFNVDGARVGAMICQDDNFRDLTRAYVHEDVDLVVVPTFEGPPAVAPYHYRNARLRPIEFPLTLVRAAARGTSAIVAAGGEVVASLDHPVHGPGVVVADTPY